MTNTPGDDQTPHDPHQDPNQDPNQGEPGYWEQQARQPTQPPQQPGYGYGYAQPAPVQYAPDHPKATTVLVLGILGVVLCQILGPFAWSMGKKTLDEIDASGGRVGGRGAAQAGYILGIVGTVMLGLAILFLIFYVIVVAVVLGTGASATTTM